MRRDGDMPGGEAPLVSVAMSVRNAEHTVARAIRSILAQTHPNFELLIADDGSTDGTAAEIGRFGDPRVRLAARGEPRGLAARLNELIGQARGAYIARIDGDDFAYPDRFEKQVAYLEAHRDIDLLGTGAVAFRHSGAPVGAFRVESDHEAICRRPDLGFGLAHPTWMGRAAWFGRFPYPEDARRGQDQATLLAACASSRFANLAEPLLGYSQDVPTLDSIIAGRWRYAQALSRHALARGDYGLLARGVIQQGGRTLVSVPSLLLGGGERILARRFRPLTREERARFEAVRDGVG